MRTINRSVKTMRDSTKLLTAEGVITLFSIFFFIIIARLLTKIEMSSLAVFAVIIGLSGMATGLGLVTSCIQKAPELLARGEKAKAYALMKLSVVVPLLLSLVAAGIVAFFSKQISQLFFKTPDLSALIKIMAVGIVVGKVWENLSHMLSVVEKFGKLSIAKVVSNIPARMLALFLYFFFGMKGYISALILGQGMAALLMVYYLRDFIFSRSGQYSLKELISYSSPYYGGDLLRFSYRQADQLIIGVFLMPEQLATYFVARRFFGYLVLYTDALLRPIVPKISALKAKGSQAIEKAFNRTSRYLSFSLIPASFLVASLAYPLLHIYGGNKYLSAAPILSILSLTAIAYGIYSAYGMNVYIMGRPIKRFEQEGVAGVLNVGLGLSLVVPLSILGPAIGGALSLSGAALFSRHLLKKLINARFDVAALKQTLLASGVMSGLILICQLLYYDLRLVPCYALGGVLLYLFLFSRNLVRGDLDLISGYLPQRLLPLVKVIHFFGGQKLRQTLAYGLEK